MYRSLGRKVEGRSFNQDIAQFVGAQAGSADRGGRPVGVRVSAAGVRSRAQQSLMFVGTSPSTALRRDGQLSARMVAGELADELPRAVT
jgi:hypothetical protein